MNGKKVNRIMLLLVVALTSSFDENRCLNEEAKYIWVIESNSSLAIAGSSNVNSFVCDVKEYLQRDTLKSTAEEKNHRLLFLNSQLNVDVRRFDCHNRFITQDFFKTLNADDYPKLIIKFVALEQFSSYLQQQEIKAWVDIQLASTCRRMQLDLMLSRQRNGTYKLNGKRRMSFADFKLKTPSKIAGLIRINEEIDVEFELFFRALG